MNSSSFLQWAREIFRRSLLKREESQSSKKSLTLYKETDFLFFPYISILSPSSNFDFPHQSSHPFSLSSRLFSLIETRRLEGWLLPFAAFLSEGSESCWVQMGVYLSTPKTEKFSEDGENDRLRYGLSSMQGWRATMEDAHAALTDLDASTSFFGVYDGHGGKVVAKFCAKFLHQQVLKHESYSADDIGTAVQKAFFRMDEMMRGQRGWRELAVLGDKMNKFSGMIEGLIWSPRSGDKSNQVDDWAFEEGPHSDFSGPTSGCTACVAIIRGNRLVVANAGDSRCVISRNGQAYNLSRDHKPDLEVERDRILKAGGFIHAGRVNGSLNLARAIGDMEFKQNKFLPPEKQIVTANPDINTVELCDEDEFIVLACDGIWDCMSSQQLVDYIREQLKSETQLSAVCEKVLDRCLAPSTAGGEGCDNMTMILVQFKKATSSNDKPSASEEATKPVESE